MKCLIAVALCLIALGLSSCETSTTITHKEQNSAEQSQSQKPVTISEVRKTLKLARDLQSDVTRVSNEDRCGFDENAPAHLWLVNDEIRPLRERQSRLASTVTDVEARSKGKDLQVMQLAMAEENIGLANKWLDSALYAETSSHPAKARTYLNGVKTALERADSLLNGKLQVDSGHPNSAVIEVPKNIETADHQPI